jgi:hypothetical protein
MLEIAPEFRTQEGKPRLLVFLVRQIAERFSLVWLIDQTLRGRTMRPRRMQFTLRAMMIAVAVAAIWLFIIFQGITYRARHFGKNASAWNRFR